MQEKGKRQIHSKEKEIIKKMGLIREVFLLEGRLKPKIKEDKYQLSRKKEGGRYK